MMKRAHKWSKRLLLPVAALPLLSTTGSCTDYTGLAGTFVTQMTGSTFNLFVGSITQVLLETFPDSSK